MGSSIKFERHVQVTKVRSQRLRDGFIKMEMLSKGISLGRKVFVLTEFQWFGNLLDKTNVYNFLYLFNIMNYCFGTCGTLLK